MIRGVHALAICAIALSGLSVRATEFYTSRYQSLPVLDWVESRPPLAEAANAPAAADLARGLSRALPLLTIRSEATEQPGFGPPAFIQRTLGGVRDAARIELGSPGTYPPGEVPVRARLDAIVFNRALRAAAWSDLMTYELDNKDPDTGKLQARIAGPDETDGVWLITPRQGGGVATVAGHRGVVGFMLQVTYVRPQSTAADLPDLSARAEVTARQAAADWSAWLVQQLGV
ncbi:MAG: hypothetical protein LC797_03415 [Chloroflexi bacterium]|nr:hypothetical protein [Chloroflexota bacterium]